MSTEKTIDKFPVGTPVRVTQSVTINNGPFEIHLTPDDSGRVIRLPVRIGSRTMGVEFDREIGGHDCNRAGRMGYCIYVPVHLVALDPVAMYGTRRRRGRTNEGTENPPKYSIGQRVRVRHVPGGSWSAVTRTIDGWVGRIVIMGDGAWAYGIEFDRRIPNGKGHDCSNRGRYGYCYNLSEKEIEPEIRDASKMYPSRRHRPTNESVGWQPAKGERVRVLPGAAEAADGHHITRNWQNDKIGVFEGKTGVVLGFYDVDQEVAMLYMDVPGRESFYTGFNCPEVCRTLGLVPNGNRYIHALVGSLAPEIPDASKMYPSRRHRPTHESNKPEESYPPPRYSVLDVVAYGDEPAVVSIVYPRPGHINQKYDVRTNFLDENWKSHRWVVPESSLVPIEEFIMKKVTEDPSYVTSKYFRYASPELRAKHPEAGTDFGFFDVKNESVESTASTLRPGDVVHVRRGEGGTGFIGTVVVVKRDERGSIHVEVRSGASIGWYIDRIVRPVDDFIRDVIETDPDFVRKPFFKEYASKKLKAEYPEAGTDFGFFDANKYE